MCVYVEHYNTSKLQIPERLGNEASRDIKERISSAEEVVFQWDVNSSEAAR